MCVIVGTGPLEDEMKQLCESLDLGDRVRFLGFQSDVRSLLGASDLFVLSSDAREGLPLALVEAMACGLPAVVTDVGGAAEAVADGETGLLVPPHDPVALADRLALLRANPALAAAMGRAGRRRVNSLFTWARVAGDLADVYRGVARPSPRSAAHAPGLRAGAGRTLPAARIAIGQGASA